MKINKKLLLGAALGFAFFGLNSEAFATAQYDVIKQSLKARGIKNPTDEDAKIFSETDATKRKALLDKWLAAQAAGNDNAGIRAAVGAKRGAEAAKAVDDLAKGAGAAPAGGAGGGNPPPPPPAGGAQTFTIDDFRKAVGLENIPAVTDADLQQYVDGLNGHGWTPAQQKAALDDMLSVTKKLRAAPYNATDADFAVIWDLDIEFITIDHYVKNSGKTFRDLMDALQGMDGQKAYDFVLVGQPESATVAKAETDVTQMKADLDAGSAAKPDMKPYYDAIKAGLNDALAHLKGQGY